jgi:hypothetical protein
MAATEVERTETIQRPGLSAAKSRAHLSTNAKTWMSPRASGLRSLANNAHDRGHAHDHRLALAHLYARGSGGRSRHHRRQARASLGGGGITRDKALPDEVVEQSPVTDGLLIAESFRHEPESGVKSGNTHAEPYRLLVPESGLARLYQLERLQAGIAVPTDNDMVMDRDAQWLGDLHNHARHFNVGA